MAKLKLTKNITESAFDNGYWFISDLKAFAKEIGVRNSNKLRKDEIEKIIKVYISTGKVVAASRSTVPKEGPKDTELGLKPNLRIVNYTSNKETKKFIEAEALKKRPKLRKKSGARYRLNRWREDQLEKGLSITYGDLIDEYIRLNESTEPFEKIPHGRYINFIADYLKYEPGATRKAAITAWEKLKRLDIPKNYAAWKRNKAAK